MSPDTEFGLTVLAACLVLYGLLLSLPTGRMTTTASAAMTCLLAGATLVFAFEEPNSQHIDFGPLYRSFAAGSLTGFAMSAALYNWLRSGKRHSWILRLLGVPVGAAFATGTILASGWLTF